VRAGEPAVPAGLILKPDTAIARAQAARATP
jgi:hypothetical protein